MSWINDIKSDYKEIDFSVKAQKKFGLILCFILFLITIWLWINSSIIQMVVVAILVLLTGLITWKFSRALNYLYKGWMAIATLIGWIISRLITIMVFILIFIPISFLAKMTGNNFIDDKRQNSYWIKKTKDNKNFTKIY